MRLRVGPVVLWREGLSATVTVGGVSAGVMGVRTLSGDLIRYEARLEAHPINLCLSVPLVGPVRVSYWHGLKWPAERDGKRLPVSTLWRN